MKSRICLVFIIMIAFITSPSIFAASKKLSNQQDSPPINNFLNKIGYTKIPIFNKNGLLYIQGTVGNQAVYFLLDTGSIDV